MIDTQNVTNPLRLQIISFLIQHMHHCGKVQGKFSDKFGRSLSLFGGLFPFTFPYRKYCQYHPLYRVKVSGGPCTIPPDEVLPQVAVKSQCMLSIAQCILAIVPSRRALP